MTGIGADITTMAIEEATVNNINTALADQRLAIKP